MLGVIVATAGCEAPPPATPPPEHAAALTAAELDQRAGVEVDALRRRAASARGALAWDLVVEAALRRYTLSGRWEDLQVAIDAAARAEAATTAPSPTRARLALSIHDLPAAQAQLTRLAAQVLVDAPTRAFITRSLLALHLQRGEVEAARALYEIQPPAEQDPTHAWQLGLVDAARAGLHQRCHAPTPLDAAPACADLARLLTDLGLPAEAEVALTRAEALLPGWHKLRAARADAALAAGQTDTAAELLAPLWAETGDPEAAARLAQARFAQGRAAEATQLLRAATTAWEARAAAAPEAYEGHLASHLLLTGEDPRRAFTLARRDVARRANADTLLLLTRAALAAGEREAAAEALARARPLALAPHSRAALARISSETIP